MTECKECLQQARLLGMGSEREARLLARCAELERDASRYRWMRRTPLWAPALGAELDTAVDAAMKE